MMDGKIKTVLVDDDPEALELLETYLKNMPDIELVGHAVSGEAGLDLIKDKHPDLLFLDIDMPTISGIDVARTVRERNYEVHIVFTTAFNKYAYDVLATEPLDYLVKPFGRDKLEQVIGKLKKRKSQDEMERKFEILVHSTRNYGKVKFPTKNGIVIIHSDDIGMIKAQGNACQVFLNDGTVETINISMNKSMKLISNPNVFRIGRSTVINLKYLRRFDRSSQSCVLSINGTTYEEPISRKAMAFFDQMRCFPIM